MFGFFAVRRILILMREPTNQGKTACRFYSCIEKIPLRNYTTLKLSGIHHAHPFGIIPLRNYTTLKHGLHQRFTDNGIIPLRNYTTLKRNKRTECTGVGIIPLRDYTTLKPQIRFENQPTYRERDAQSVSSTAILYLTQVFVNNQSPFFRQTGMFPGIHQKERVLVVDGCLEETLNRVIREIAAQIYKDE